jgi:hypothetical protein
MAKGLAVAIVLDAAEKRELTALTRKHGAPQSIAGRTRIVLAAGEGLNNKEIAAKVGVCAATAGNWRNRFPLRRRTRKGHHRLHRSDQRPSQAVPLDKERRRYPRQYPALLPSYTRRKSLE